MVSISDVSAGQAAHYYSKDNYYSKQEGEWQGKGAEKLGLQGEVKKEDFEKLLNGQGPKNEFQIANGGENQNHRAALDLTFSAPKSVSVLSEVLGDDRVREAHEKAVSSTLSHVEQHFSQARQTINGITEKIDTGNLAIAKFEHNTSRELDPQLHTHTVVMNMTQRPDGSWRALSNEQIYQNKMLIGQIYRNELAANLKDLGYSIQSNNKGLFEVQGIEQKLLDHFSQRKDQINAKINELKENGQYKNAGEQKLREIATLGSRIAKRDVDIQTVKESWVERMQGQGYTKENVRESIQKAAEQMKKAEINRKDPKMNEYDYIRLAGKIVTEQEATFSKEDILKTAGKLSLGEYRISKLEKAFNSLNGLGQKEIKTLDKNIYTTAEMQKIEKDIVFKVQAGHHTKETIMTKEQAEAGIKAFEAQKSIKMTQGQKEAVNHILSSEDRYIGIQGDAGTGKTTMLKAVKDQFEKQGYKVQGLGFTGKAAAEVEAQAGIKSQTIDSFLAQQDKINGGERGIWIVDESSMLGSKKMHGLMSAAEKTNARVVFIGDTKQLQAVEAGKMFSKLQETGDLKTVRMSEVQRQKDEQYKDIVKDISEKKINRAFDKLEKQDCVKETADRQERLNAIVKDYTGKNYKDTIIVTARNTDRNELNTAIRAELKEQGKLSTQGHTFTVRESKGLSPVDKHFAQNYGIGDKVIFNKAGIAGRAGREAKVTAVDHQSHKIKVHTKDGKEHQINLKTKGQHLAVYSEKEQSFSQGDKVVFLKNDKSLSVKNGQIGDIKSIDKNGKATIRMETGQEKTINLKTQYNYVDHGYAITDYKSQGQTSKNVIYHADTSKKVNYNQAYVAVTRGKHDLKIYTDSKENLKEQLKHEQVKTSTLDYSEIEKSKAGREAITKMEQEEYKGKGVAEKIMHIEEKMIDKIPVVKSFLRDIDKNNFHPGKAEELMKQREKELEKHAKTGSQFSKWKAEKIEKKLEAEFAKMSPEQQKKFQAAKTTEKSKSESGYSKSGGQQGKEVEMSK
jgi:conjugative relaxase-like TrwC/TraI family protein